MEKVIKGSVKMYVMINSTNYNGDGEYQVLVGNLEDMKRYGASGGFVNHLKNMKVDEVALTDFEGCYVIRIA